MINVSVASKVYNSLQFRILVRLDLHEYQEFSLVVHHSSLLYMSLFPIILLAFVFLTILSMVYILIIMYILHLIQ